MGQSSRMAGVVAWEAKTPDRSNYFPCMGRPPYTYS